MKCHYCTGHSRCSYYHWSNYCRIPSCIYCCKTTYIKATTGIYNWPFLLHQFWRWIPLYLNIVLYFRYILNFQDCRGSLVFVLFYFIFFGANSSSFWLRSLCLCMHVFVDRNVATRNKETISPKEGKKRRRRNLMNIHLFLFWHLYATFLFAYIPFVDTFLSLLGCISPIHDCSFLFLFFCYCSARLWFVSTI